MTRKALGKASATGKGTSLHLRVAHRIEVLLHTMRTIARQEEQLCVVMTEIRGTGAVSAGTRQELTALLAELPGEAYQMDLDAVEEALAGTLEVKAGGAGARKARGKKNKKPR